MSADFLGIGGGVRRVWQKLIPGDSFVLEFPLAVSARFRVTRQFPR
jgi:hypothetical protein